MVWGGCTMVTPVHARSCLLFDSTLWQIHTRLANRSLLWVLDDTGYRTTAVYNPKSDTTAVFRNVGTGVCSVLDRSMGQWGETHTRCWAE